MGRIEEAHKHSINNKEELSKSNSCGCFYCKEIFNPSIIEEWTDNKTTAICPKCGVDSIIGDASNYNITNNFLSLMRDAWFSWKSKKDK